MKYSNLHNHTVFSDGKQTVEENARAAIERGMCSIGFSDHSFTDIDTSYCMMAEDYPAYIAEVKRVKQEYSDRIKVYLGIEKDYYSTLNAADFDYVIGSVHYIVEGGVTYPIDHSPEQQRDCIDTAFGGDVLAMAQRYFSMVAEQARTARPTFIGHFDVINKFSLTPEEDPRYVRLVLDALEQTVKYCPYLEINTGGMSRGWRSFPYPSPYVLSALREMGGKVLLGADSHDTKNLTFYFDESVEIAKKAGYKTISVFNGKGFDEVEIP